MEKNKTKTKIPVGERPPRENDKEWVADRGKNGLITPRPKKAMAQGTVLTWVEAPRPVREHRARAGPWTSVEEVGRDTDEEHGVGDDAGVCGSWLVPRFRTGRLTFHEAVLQPQTEYHYFPQMDYFFPFMGILALNFLTVWWINFVLMFINALFTFPRVKFWLVIRFSVSAVMRHCCSEPDPRKMNFILLWNQDYLKKI